MKPYKYDERWFDIISKKDAIGSINFILNSLRLSIEDDNEKLTPHEAIRHVASLVELETEFILEKGRE